MPISIWEIKRNGSPFPYGDPHMETGIEHPHSIGVSLFPYGESNERAPHFHTGIPIRKRGFTQPHFHTGTSSVTNTFQNRVCAHLGIEEKIAIWECFPYGDCRFHMVILIWKQASRLSKFLFGDSPFQDRVCYHLGINIYNMFEHIDMLSMGIW
jgi:hypothetical protein